jgi:hypothetical protein
MPIKRHYRLEDAGMTSNRRCRFQASALETREGLLATIGPSRQSWLTKRDAVGDCVNGALCAVSILGATGAEVFQPVGLQLCPLNQSSIFVSYLTG